MSVKEIELSRIEKGDIDVLKQAIQSYYEGLLTQENQSEEIKMHQSILQNLFSKFFDASNKTYKQVKFSFKLMWHEATLINKALGHYNKSIADDYKKNVALGLILVLDPQTV